MTLTVRPADLDVDRETLLGVLERNLTDLPHRRRFDWLYRANPAGPAWCWLAGTDADDRVIGAASVFPHAIWLDGKPAVAGQVGDFAIDATHRSLGPAVMLQRATFQPVDRGTLAFCYDCPPHERGMAPFRRLGLEPSRETRRYARLLRADRWLAGRLPSAAGLVLRPFANLALTLPYRARRRAGLEIASHTGRFGEEFDALDRAMAEPAEIRSRRSAADLNWRYRDNPLRCYEALTARRRGELVAFVVFSAEAEDVALVDLFGRVQDGVGLVLLEALAGLGRARGKQTLQTVSAHPDGLSGMLVSAGFRVRSEGPRVVAYAGARTGRAPWPAPPARWSFQAGDLYA